MPVKPALKKPDGKPQKKAPSQDAQPAREKRTEDTGDGGWSEPMTVSVKPFNQLDLTEKELKAEL